VEITDPAERAVRLAEWVDLPRHLFVRLGDGRTAPARWDERQIDERKLSSVQFLKFDCGGQVPVALGCTLPALREEAPLTDAQRAALAEDLAGD
jgi:hypothetical protein